MRAVIIANGWLNHPVSLEAHDLLIAANGGALHCLENGLQPAYVIGDLDSLEAEHIRKLESDGAVIVRFPTRKDYTDLELAVQYAQELGAQEILILAALGARWDQTIANILLCATSEATPIRIVDSSQEICFLNGRKSVEISGHPGDTVSLIPLAGDAYGITTSGLEYGLEKGNLRLGSTRGVSNVMLSNRATIHLEEGLLLCTVIHS